MSDYKFINTTVVRRLDISRIILYLSIHISDTYLYIYIYYNIYFDIKFIII